MEEEVRSRAGCDWATEQRISVSVGMLPHRTTHQASLYWGVYHV